MLMLLENNRPYGRRGKIRQSKNVTRRVIISHDPSAAVNGRSVLESSWIKPS